MVQITIIIINGKCYLPFSLLNGRPSWYKKRERERRNSRRELFLLTLESLVKSEPFSSSRLLILVGSSMTVTTHAILQQEARNKFFKLIYSFASILEWKNLKFGPKLSLCLSTSFRPSGSEKLFPLLSIKIKSSMNQS